jgi:hypothetical protein
MNNLFMLESTFGPEAKNLSSSGMNSFILGGNLFGGFEMGDNDDDFDDDFDGTLWRLPYNSKLTL